MSSLSPSVESAVKDLMLIHKLCLDSDFGSKKKVITKLTYDQENEVYVLLMIDDDINLTTLIDLDGSAITQQKLAELKMVNLRLFGETVRADDWHRLFCIFVDPVLNLIPANFKGYIFTILESKDFPENTGENFFNIAHIYNLSFLFAETKAYHNQITFINVSEDAVKFIGKLSVTQRPLANDIDIIYGFPKQYDAIALEADPNNEKMKRGKAREDAFMQGITDAQANGAQVYIFSDISIFESLFNKEHTGRVVQLLTHFHNGRIYSPNLKTFVHITSLAKLLDQMFYEDRLREDISLHAATCSNYDYFHVLVKKGIKSIYYSSNNLNLNNIAGRFAELYSGYNAKITGFDYPYLDGQSFIFEAWEKVFRCFCKLNFIYSQNIRTKIL